MIEVTVKSKISGRFKTGSFTARELLHTYEDDLVCNLTQCNCQPVGETYVVECNCDEEWEEYDLFFSDGF
ncbi:acetyltransferase [Bacillus subtilis]|uniref:acetyltransferase n=1 Tax=Bacillus subtilis TaxID=1423 RepID=UPI001F2431ED|nr:acetyltransferase [Bacillus subtilis]MEC2137378.1 acetyltransferase [Bacillus subtilis]UJE04048.1 acetyltransferase [Bacillus subtilis]